jgi:hypothetical protein
MFTLRRSLIQVGLFKAKISGHFANQSGMKSLHAQVGLASL